ncbi:MAG TPA: glycosyltransferase family 4 protein [Gaiellaceae bacterium]
MKVLIVSGIWPPDVGGPASHAPEVAAELTERGHTVEVVTTASAPPAAQPYRVRYVSRSLPPGARHAAVSALVARAARRTDVVYATSMLGRTAVGAAIVHAPLVLKVSGDPAYERSLRRGWYTGTLADFQHAQLGAQPAALRRWRTLAAGRPAKLVCPSAFLREIVLSWGVAPDRVTVVPNAAPLVPDLPSREDARIRFGVDGPALAFAGRLTAAKALDVAFDAVAQIDDVTLFVAGDGEERARLAARAPENVRLLGPLDRRGVLELFRAADAALLSSAWENFPHALVEALAVGTPVLATRVGGIPEIVVDGENGLLVPAGDAAALTDAIRRFFSDAGLRTALTDAAAPSTGRFAPERTVEQLEAILQKAAR